MRAESNATCFTSEWAGTRWCENISDEIYYFESRKTDEMEEVTKTEGKDFVHLNKEYTMERDYSIDMFPTENPVDQSEGGVVTLTPKTGGGGGGEVHIRL